MDNIDFNNPEGFYAFSDFTDNRSNTFPQLQSYLNPTGWAFSEEDLEAEMQTRFLDTGVEQQSTQPYPSNPNRQNAVANASNRLNSAELGLALAGNMNNAASILQQEWQFGYQAPIQHSSYQTSPSDNSYEAGAFNGPLQSSPIEYLPSAGAEMQLPMHVSSATLPVTQYLSMAGPMESMGALAYPLNEYQTELMTFPLSINAGLGVQTAGIMPNMTTIQGTSPTGSNLEVCSLSSSDNGWTAVSFAHARHSLDSYGTGNAVFNPGQTLHIRTESDSSSDASQPEQLSGSYEEMPFPMYSPSSETNGFDFVHAHGHRASHNMSRQHSDHECAVHSPQDFSSPTSVNAMPHSARPVSASSSSTSPTASSPPIRRRKSPPGPPALAKTTKAVIKKDNPAAIRKSTASDKKVGRRKGPLRPDQRQQAHEIRKLRACLRCKFLKKTCDKGDPCAGCRPSHARLWQVPCTRIDIKDIAYFMKDYKADYERHVSLGFSVNNIKGFSSMERTLYITHGFGHFLPVNAREVYVTDDSCFGVDWAEANPANQYEVSTAKLAAGMEGVSSTLLSEYIDRHLENNFEEFVAIYFEGTTPFMTDILITAYKYWRRTKTPVVRKALKLIIAYNLTVHITMVEGLSEEEAAIGRVDDETSRFAGKVVAPVMINFQVKCALADMWRELQKDILEELSSLYSSVYQGDKLRHWPTIFMLASILLAVWELMQFDCHYREPDEKKVEKFCNDMESTPVGVIVGLFQAISQKLPSFMEWDTSKHSNVLNGDGAICDALTEVKGLVSDNETYLRSRPEAKYNRDDFESLSNKFLSRLVIRAS